MATENELASAVARRSIGNAPVTRREWPGFAGVRLEGKWVSLAPIDPARDATDLFLAATQGEKPDQLWDYLGYGPFADETEMRIWLKGCAESNDPIFLGYRDKTTKQLGGMGGFMEIRPAFGVAEIGNIWFGHAWRRDKRSTEALSLMMHHTLDTLGYRRLEWKCNALNAPSRAAALRLGFRYEGEFLNHLLVKGRSRDTAWFSITEAEWPAVRSAHAQWFAENNFDTYGTQKSSLSDLTRALW